MKQKVSFFETDSAKLFTAYTHQGLSHFFEAFLGAMWVGFLWLFVMFLSKYYSYYKKGVLEDKKEYKIIYRDMKKKSRRIVGAFVLFCLITLALICSVEESFIRCALKGGAMCSIIIPLLNNHYGDKKRFKFSF